METLLATGAIVFLAAAVQGLSGFGFTLVALSIMPAVHDLRFAVPLVAVFSLGVSCSLAWRLRGDMSVRRVLPLLVGGLVGVPFGVFFLKSADPTAAVAALGAVLIGYSAWALWSAAPAHREPRRPVAYLTGLAAGLLGGAFGTSGPPLVAYTTMTPWGRDTIKATLQAFFVLTGAFTVSLYGYNGLLSAEGLRINAIVFPVLLVGVWAGARLADRIDQAAFRRLLLVCLLIVGVTYVGRWLTA